MPNGLTLDDINNLKREKQALLRERVTLRTRIERYRQFSRQKRPPERSAKILEAIKQRIASMEELGNEKNEEMARILQSDRAAEIGELQEICLILYQEIRRLQLRSGEVEGDLGRLREDVAVTRQRYAPEAVARKERQMQAIVQALRNQREKNGRVLTRIERLKSEGAEPGVEDEGMKREMDRLRGLIQEEREKVKKVGEEVEKERARHRDVLAEFKENGFDRSAE